MTHHNRALICLTGYLVYLVGVRLGTWIHTVSNSLTYRLVTSFFTEKLFMWTLLTDGYTFLI